MSNAILIMAEKHILTMNSTPQERATQHWIIQVRKRPAFLCILLIFHKIAKIISTKKSINNYENVTFILFSGLCGFTYHHSTSINFHKQSQA